MKFFKKFINSYLSIIVIVLVMVGTFLLGSRMIFNGNFYLLSDQGRDFLLVKSIVVDHKLTLIGTHSGVGGFFHGPVWLYILAPIFIFGHGNPLYFAYFDIMLAEITVLIAFLLSKKLYGNFISLVFTGFVGLSSIIWGYITNAIGVNMMPLLYVLLFFFIIKYLRGNNKSFIIVSFLTGLSFQFETASAIALVPIIFLTYFYHKKNIFNFRLILFSIISFFISISNFLIFDIRHQFIISKSILSLFNINSVHNKGYLPLTARFTDHLNSLLGVYKGPFLIQNNLFYVFCLLIFCLFIFIIFLNWRENNKFSEYFTETIYLFLFPIFTFIIYIFYPYTVWPEYVLGLLIPLSLSYALIFNTIKNYKFGILLQIIFLLIYILSLILQIKNTYAEKIYDTSSGSFINQENIIKFIFKDAKGENFGYFVYSPDTFTYSMDYLFWWNGLKYNYIPNSQKLKTTYLIMYPHLGGDNNAYNFWKRYVIRTNASVVFTKTFPGGITVQKLDIIAKEEDVDPNYYQNLIFR